MGKFKRRKNMTTKELIERIKQACAGNLNWEVSVKTVQRINMGDPDNVKWESFTFETYSSLVSSNHPAFITIEIPM
jgi:archaellum biogenesis protein FlaJ (TadC family)